MKLKHWIGLFLTATIVVVFATRQLTSSEAVVASVNKGTAVNAVSGNVRVFSSMNALIHAEANGRVLECLSVTGKDAIEVQEGDTILKIDTTEIDREITNFKARHEALVKRNSLGSYTELQLDSFKQDMALYEHMYERGEYPEAEIVKRRRDLKTMQMNVDNEKINQSLELKLQETELDRLTKIREKMEIKAPFNGLITETFLLPGMQVYSGTNVATIMSKDNIIEVSIAEEDFPGIEAGQEVSLYFQGYNTTALKAKITATKATADTQSKRRGVFVEVLEQNDKIVPGMTGQASIIKAKREGALIIPRRALAGNFVYVINKGQVDIRKVQPGYVGVDYAEVLANLKEGENIITENLFNYRQGQKIRLAKKS